MITIVAVLFGPVNWHDENVILQISDDAFVT